MQRLLLKVCRWFAVCSSSPSRKEWKRLSRSSGEDPLSSAKRTRPNSRSRKSIIHLRILNFQLNCIRPTPTAPVHTVLFCIALFRAIPNHEHTTLCLSQAWATHFSQSLLRITLLASPLNHPLACTTMSLDVGSLRLASLVHLGSEKG